MRQLNERSKNCPSCCRMRTPALTSCCFWQSWKRSKGDTQPTVGGLWTTARTIRRFRFRPIGTCLARRRQVLSCKIVWYERSDGPTSHMCVTRVQAVTTILFESSHKTSVIHHLRVHTEEGKTKTCSASDEDLSTPASFLFFSLEALGIEPRTTRPTVRLSCFLVCACLQRGSSCPSVTHSAIHAAR
jgi:hypothetical protein